VRVFLKERVSLSVLPYGDPLVVYCMSLSVVCWGQQSGRWIFAGCYSVRCDMMAFCVNITGDSQMDYTRATLVPTA
jgi:hypothetical protein